MTKKHNHEITGSHLTSNLHFCWMWKAKALRFADAATKSIATRSSYRYGLVLKDRSNKYICLGTLSHTSSPLAACCSLRSRTLAVTRRTVSHCAPPYLPPPHTHTHHCWKIVAHSWIVHTLWSGRVPALWTVSKRERGDEE